MNLCYYEHHSNSAYTNTAGVVRYTTAMCSNDMNHNMTQKYLHVSIPMFGDAMLGY